MDEDTIKTFKCLHALQNAGVLEQRLDKNLQVRWHLKKGGGKLWKQLKKELGLDT